MTNKNNDINKLEMQKYLKKDFHNFFDIVIFDELESTNSFLKSNIDKFENNTLLIANRQSKGRGRQNKSFLSKDSSGIYFSFLIKNQTDNFDFSLITIAAALLVSDSLDSIYGINTKIKWVNDVYLNEKKISGILSEGKYNIDKKRHEYFIIGIGVNVNNKKLPDEIINLASSLYIETGLKKNKNFVLAIIANNFYKYLDQTKNNKKLLIESYKNKMLYIGEDIEVLSKSNSYFAKLLGLNDKGELKVIDNQANIKYLNSGEIRIKSMED